jgi:hypothetical protein
MIFSRLWNAGAAHEIGLRSCVVFVFVFSEYVWWFGLRPIYLSSTDVCKSAAHNDVGINLASDVRRFLAFQCWRVLIFVSRVSILFQVDGASLVGGPSLDDITRMSADDISQSLSKVGAGLGLGVGYGKSGGKSLPAHLICKIKFQAISIPYLA